MNILLLFTLFFSFLVSPLRAELLDKIVAVIDDEVVSLSQINQIKSNLASRKTISPIVYSNEKMTDQQIVDTIINGRLSRDKLNEVGIVIADEMVEEQIKLTEQRLGLSRSDLLQYLESNRLTFDEYFELTREAMENQYFHQKVIRPLISITEQEVKNEFYKKNVNNQTLAFRYNLVDFSLPKASVTGDMLKHFKDVLTNFQISGDLPKEFKSLETNVIGDITEDGLAKNLKDLLKVTDEGKFSDPLSLGDGKQHVFYVKKKDLVESELFIKQKMEIQAELFYKQSKITEEVWFQRERNKHYIKTFF
ncbi:MAG: hypothetical protein A2504_05820 [Bdellovibrionales bacterium RIFOXYD12_FULL_39_22]|nr:MAG: hypothetical protein A2385_06005 [Bdellovibrionales bacterium RIFOXYB1_FULL_39_21]OFZ41833.1 MAG: hypothetical protein A2485_07975 [Bdellovibrionales bacterium RIFOXYC12_FULL_39_17]OFZ50549.1 MAG: hypothetical protein A2404_04925 [Bdellovibrionales bacterium RIFOXYC1_FULL_39_130]OFZ77772.1 MAG: hypothetical protein A2560_00095 [Bdellovibrionales bacterium RIFOXYD1_FULL_39_84]OFZ93792.1 MAG: hypothetical protein A2504_05820 [Bdellovibrionales bacterium RIFOXYD12_FULL_39_22]HLE11521.1 Su